MTDIRAIRTLLFGDIDSDENHMLHGHHCPGCNETWQHRQDFAWGYEEAHKCPKCSAPTYIRCWNYDPRSGEVFLTMSYDRYCSRLAADRAELAS